jgi:hypothetical protein
MRTSSYLELERNQNQKQQKSNKILKNLPFFMCIALTFSVSLVIGAPNYFGEKLHKAHFAKRGRPKRVGQVDQLDRS